MEKDDQIAKVITLSRHFNKINSVFGDWGIKFRTTVDKIT